jgi:hypothetical protein
MYEYKIITQKDRVFGGKFNPELIQNGLNGFSGAREELVFVLEREVD